MPLQTDQWVDLITPEQILARRTFEGVAVDPPDLEPGSWVGAGNMLFDEPTGAFWLTTRWKRKSEGGFSWDSAVQLYRSADGERFEPSTTLHRRELAELLEDDSVRGVEGQQLVRDPATGEYRLYLAIHREGRGWDTALLTADHPSGPWKGEGTVIPLGDDFDALDARDAVISILDGRYVALYKAASGQRLDGWQGGTRQEREARQARVNVAWATSEDGVTWTKHGLFRLDGGAQPQNFLLSGNILATPEGPLFVGIESRGIIDGITCGDTFVAYRIDEAEVNLVPVFSGRWTPGSPHEREDYPIHTYMDVAADPARDRLLLTVEAIDPELTREIGIDTEVDRLLLYSVAL